MAQGGSLIVPRWSIRVSLTTSCRSQSMYTLICDNLPFLVWILAHITVQAWASFRLEESVDFDAQIPKAEVLSLYEIVTPNTVWTWSYLCLFPAGWYVDKTVYGMDFQCPQTILSWTVGRNYATHHLTLEGSVDVRSVPSCLRMHFSITWRFAFMASWWRWTKRATSAQPFARQLRHRSPWRR